MSEWGEEESDEIPLPYYLQCQWYCGLLGLPDWYIAVGFVKPGSRNICYREYRIEHDAARYAAMVQRAVEFWENHVVPRIPPPITVADNATVAYYNSKYPQHTPDKWVYSDERIDALAAEYLQLRADNKVREGRADAMEVELKKIIGDCEGLKTASGKFTWRTTKPRHKVNWEGCARFLGASDETIEDFTTEQPGTRPFLIPKGGGAT